MQLAYYLFLFIVFLYVFLIFDLLCIAALGLIKTFCLALRAI